jgi:hypothetical protein
MELPEAPEGEDTLPYDMMTALSMCQSYDAFYEQLKKHNVPQDILEESMKIPERCVEINRKRSGRPRLTSFDWYQHAYDGRLYRIGRLQLEFPLSMPNAYRLFESKDGEYVALANMQVHSSGIPLGSFGAEDEEGAFTATYEETESAYIGHPFDKNGYVSPEKVTLQKSEWSVKLTGGDRLVNLHIPPDEPFGEEIIDDAIARSREFLKNCYPEYHYKAFLCASWLLDTTLVELLGEDANISKFCKRFIPFRMKSNGKAPFNFVFKRYGDIKIEELPENSRLQKILKKHYLDGKAIYDTHGVFF